MLRFSFRAVAFSLLVGCLVFLPFQSSASAQAALTPTVVTYYGCVENSSGAIRIVSKTTVCKSTEHKISWNQLGPKGPPGPQGPQGAQGPQGPPGISVGYSSVLPYFAGVSLSNTPTLMLQTNPIVTSGTYFISASALGEVAAGDQVFFCYDALASNGIISQAGGGGSSGGSIQASISDVLSINVGDAVQVYCYVGGTNGSLLENAVLTATLINSPDDAPRRAGKSSKRPGIHGKKPH